MDELIEVVRKYEPLYNSKHRDYKDHQVRAAVWEEISQQLNEPVETCKDNWTKLRNAYTNAIKRRKTKSTIQMPAWKYEDEMKFLRPYIRWKKNDINLSMPKPESPTNQYSNQYSPPDFLSIKSRSSSASQPPLSPSFSDMCRRNSISKNSLPEQNKLGLRDMYDLMKSSNDEKQQGNNISWMDMDETDLFFLSMSKSLKALPKLDQTKIKLDLHTAISQAEIRNLKKTS